MSECNPGERLKWTVLWITADWDLGVRAEGAFKNQSVTNDEVADLFHEIIEHDFSDPAKAVARLAQWMADTIVAVAGLDDSDPRKQATQAFEKGLAEASRETIALL